MPDMPSDHPAESVLVMLTRMEGKFDRAIDQIATANRDIAELKQADREHVSSIADLRSTTQRLDEQATAEQAKAVALAAALKEAEATRRQKSEQTFTPWQRLAGFAIALATVGTFLLLWLKRP